MLLTLHVEHSEAEPLSHADELRHSYWVCTSLLAAAFSCFIPARHKCSQDINKEKPSIIMLLIWHDMTCISMIYNSIIFFLFDSELYRKTQSTCAWPIKTVRWTRGGGTAASSAVSRNVSQWEWSKKVMQCQALLKLSVTNEWWQETGVCNDSLVKPKLGMRDM